MRHSFAASELLGPCRLPALLRVMPASVPSWSAPAHDWSGARDCGGPCDTPCNQRSFVRVDMDRRILASASHWSPGQARCHRRSTNPFRGRGRLLIRWSFVCQRRLVGCKVQYAPWRMHLGVSRQRLGRLAQRVGRRWTGRACALRSVGFREKGSCNIMLRGRRSRAQRNLVAHGRGGPRSLEFLAPRDPWVGVRESKSAILGGTCPLPHVSFIASALCGIQVGVGSSSVRAEESELGHLGRLGSHFFYRGWYCLV